MQVEFYFRYKILDQIHALALVHLFSPPDQDNLKSSHGTVWTCHYLGNEGIRVVKVTDIEAVVSIIPFAREDGNAYRKNMVYFVMERVGMAMGILGQPDDAGEDDDDDDDDNSV